MNDGGYYLSYTFLVNESGCTLSSTITVNLSAGVKTLRAITNAKNSNLVMVSLSHDAEMVYTVLNRNKRQKFRKPSFFEQANDSYDGAVLLSLRGSRIRFRNLYFEE